MIISHVVDDFGGEGEARTVRFSVDHQQYSVDLNEENLKKFFEALRPYMRNQGLKRGPQGARGWAVQQGLLEAGMRGPTPKWVVERYEEHLEQLLVAD